MERTERRSLRRNLRTRSPSSPVLSGGVMGNSTVVASSTAARDSEGVFLTEALSLRKLLPHWTRSPSASSGSSSSSTYHRVDRGRLSWSRRGGARARRVARTLSPAPRMRLPTPVSGKRHAKPDLLMPPTRPASGAEGVAPLRARTLSRFSTERNADFGRNWKSLQGEDAWVLLFLVFFSVSCTLSLSLSLSVCVPIPFWSPPAVGGWRRGRTACTRGNLAWALAGAAEKVCAQAPRPFQCSGPRQPQARALLGRLAGHAEAFGADE